MTAVAFSILMAGAKAAKQFGVMGFGADQKARGDADTNRS
jgi:hypothetical protein